MQVHYDEGLAIHIGPEPCVGVREDDGEASVGEGIGQTLSPENLMSTTPKVNSVLSLLIEIKMSGCHASSL